MNKQPTFKLGLYTIADIATDPLNGRKLTHQQRQDEIMKIARLSDEAGLDVFGVYENKEINHDDSSLKLLSDIAACTKQIKLLYATATGKHQRENNGQLLQELSAFRATCNGRAELMAEMGEAFEPLQVKLQETNDSLPIWAAVNDDDRDGAEQAGRTQARLALSILEGEPERFQHIVERYRSAAAAAGVSVEEQHIAVLGQMYLAQSDALASRQYYSYYQNYWAAPSQHHKTAAITPEQFRYLSEPDSVLFVGSPELIVEKILQQHEVYGHTRFLAQIDVGGMPFKWIAKNIEYFATRVAPIIRKELNK